MGSSNEPGSAIVLSVVVPVYNEQDNIEPLLQEIITVIEPFDIGYEVLYVDDCSVDGSEVLLRQLLTRYPRLRVLRHQQRSGQSTAICSGIMAARGEWIVTLDGDGQNPPAEIATLWQHPQRQSEQVGMLAGWRKSRHDDWIKRLSSRIANVVRSSILGDATPDTGCGLKLFQRQLFLGLPYFDHMHRFLPALVRRAGFEVVSVPVAHRSRQRGVSKYGLNNRLWAGLVDLAGVYWLKRRSRITAVEELE
ncbi:MAG TPA: glycosyltransferase [Gammaproteobacteria bacterium]|nr:glycosyltransferase [Gammaproteobacteria bacterium]